MGLVVIILGSLASRDQRVSIFFYSHNFDKKYISLSEVIPVRLLKK